MARLRYDGLSTTLGASLTSGGTTITFAAALTYAGGTSVPTVSGSTTDYIPLSIMSANGRLAETVYLTAYTSGATSGTITRAREGTPAAARASGLRVIHGPTVADLAIEDSGDLASNGNFDGSFRFYLVGGRLVFVTGGVRRLSGYTDTNFYPTGIVVPASMRPTVVTTSPAGNAYNGHQYQFQVQTDGVLTVRMLTNTAGFMSSSFPPWPVA